jgi:hypothetical protein
MCDDDDDGDDGDDGVVWYRFGRIRGDSGEDQSTVMVLESNGYGVRE